MPRSKEYEVEVRFSGYVTLAVKASSLKAAANKAKKIVKYDMGMKSCLRPKYGPEITDDFHEVEEDTSIEEVGRG
jgi:hypothetical protein